MNDTPSTTSVLPIVTESYKTPLDPAIMEMLGEQVQLAVWPCVDKEATNCAFENAKKVSPNGYHNWRDYRHYKRNPVEIAAVKAAIQNLTPQDAIEAMLASQITAVHLAAIECLNHASWEVDSVENRTSYLKAASKLSRTFAELTKVLDHHRGKGKSEQQITVVHINDGAQAIIGNVGRGMSGKNGEPHAP